MRRKLELESAVQDGLAAFDDFGADIEERSGLATKSANGIFAEREKAARREEK